MTRLALPGSLLTALFGVALTMLALPPPAHACGGFFCNNSQPVNQAAERIIFSVNDDGTVTAVIQIQYVGPSEHFAWVLPVGGEPDVQVSSDAAFQRLQAATNPLYQLTTTIEGSCRGGGFRGGPSSGADAAAAADAGADAGPPPVTVVDRGSVGPYDYIVISVDPGTTTPADTAVQWLRDNGYDVSEMGIDRLSPYLMAGMNLLAFRLTKGSDTGSIRPVMIRFGSGLPMIPIRPTAVAATEDMGVMVWLLGPHRAVPVNYRSLVLNEALINWNSPGSTYNDVVSAAADEAGGQGFVTEMAGPAASLADTIWQPWEEDAWARFQTSDWTSREGELLNTLISQFAYMDGMRDAVRDSVPLPDGVELDELLSCISCYYSWELPDIDRFEPADFIAAVETNVIEPMTRTRELFEGRAYATRLYTTMSPDEMSMDPVFDFNPDLPDVSNVHNAERVIECSPSVTRSEAPWRVVLESGDVVRGQGTSWPFLPGEGEMPATREIRRIGNSGVGEVDQDNTAAIARLLRRHNATVAGPPDARGCSVGPMSTAGASLLPLALVAGALFLRRRRGQ